MKKVLILMSTYNGEKYLKDQIESILQQTYKYIDVLVRDDGSTDGTASILNHYQDLGKLKWYSGNNLKPARSFMDLVNNCDSTYDFYAFADQDDIWLPNKIEKAVLQLTNDTKPALYYCATNNVTSELEHIDFYFRNPKAAKSFKTSLKTGCLIPGCTMVFNNLLLMNIRKYNPQYIGMHDIWLHIVCLAIGGAVYADEQPYIQYRQHSNNAVGSKKRGFAYRIKRFFGKPHDFSSVAKEILIGYGDEINDDSKVFLESNSNYLNNFKCYKYCLFDKCFDGANLNEIILYKLKIIFKVF